MGCVYHVEVGHEQEPRMSQENNKPKFEVDQPARVKATGYVGEVYSRILDLNGDSYCYKLIHGIDYEWYKENELEAV